MTTATGLKLAMERARARTAANNAATPVQISNEKLFRDGAEYLPDYITPNKYPFIEALREASLNADFERLFQLMPKEKWTNVPLGKFRFLWGSDGKPRWVTFSHEDMKNYFSGPWLVIDKSWGGVCPDDFIKKYSYDYFVEHQRSASMRPNTHPHHMYRKMFPAHLVCKAKKGSVWVRVRKPVVAAAAIVAAVYLGPAVLSAVQNAASSLTGGLIPGAGGGAAGGATGAAGAATSGSKVLQGAKTLVGYVNKANTIKAIANGQLPPPPISIGGASFAQWATIVAKDEIKKEAMNAAMEAGTKYVEKKMTEKEERALQAEIAEMQKQLLAITPRSVVDAPPQPDPELAAPIKNIQDAEVSQFEALKPFLAPAAIVAAALLLGA